MIENDPSDEIQNKKSKSDLVSLTKVNYKHFLVKFQNNILNFHQRLQ
jgi:hypothetical protein